MQKQTCSPYYLGSQNLFQGLRLGSSSSFIIGFIQMGKEPHTSSMVQSFAHPFLHRSPSSFTRFLGENVWAVDEISHCLTSVLPVLRIKAGSVLFLIVNDTIGKKTGKKMAGCAWHKDQACRSHVLAHTLCLAL